MSKAKAIAHVVVVERGKFFKFLLGLNSILFGYIILRKLKLPFLFEAWLSNSRVYSFEFTLTLDEFTRKQTRFWSKLGRLAWTCEFVTELASLEGFFLNPKCALAKVVVLWLFIAFVVTSPLFVVSPRRCSWLLTSLFVVACLTFVRGNVHRIRSHLRLSFDCAIVTFMIVRWLLSFDRALVIWY